MKKWIKKFLKSQKFLNFLSWIICHYLKLIFYTTRWSWIGKESAQHNFETKPFIICFWHGRLAMIPFMHTWPKNSILSMVSGHNDGMIIAKTFKRLNIDYTTGSTNKGGVRAFISLLKALREDRIAAIIPDGPRGPAQKLSRGVLELSRHANVPIMPLTYATTWFVEFNSWDKFRLPLPFSKGVFIYGTPISPINSDAESDIEAWRLRVESALTDLQNQADKFLNN